MKRLLTLCCLFVLITIGISAQSPFNARHGDCFYCFYPETKEASVIGINWFNFMDEDYNVNRPLNVIVESPIVYDGVEYQVKSVDQGAFQYKQILSITLPLSVNYIGSNAFNGCTELTSITGCMEVLEIGEWAFAGCSELKQFLLPSNLTFISNHTFYNCINLTSIDLPGSIKWIGEAAFYNCKKMRSVYMCKEVEEIKEDAFRECNSLTEVNIPFGCTTIGPQAFYRCTGLEKVTLPSTLTRINKSAFQGCNSLTSIVLPLNLSYIGSGAFSNCNLLLDITAEMETPPSIDTQAFLGLYSKSTLHVYEESIEKYKNAAVWKKFNTITSITGYAGVPNVSNNNDSKGNKRYNLKGLHIDNNTPKYGIYIQNGKKYFENKK